MQTHFLFDVLDGYKPFEQMAQESQNSGAVIAASGMAGAQKAHAACALAARTGRPLLFLCDSERSATQTMEDVSTLLGGGVCLLPAREITFYQDVAASREVAYRRIEAMRRVLSGEARAIVAPADAMLHRMMPREAFNRNTISLRVGDVTPIDLLIERLLAAGYTREYMVEGKGQFSVRGGIIDVYPADALSAVRIEFFDDELDSIRAVDVMSQRSQGNMQEVVIPPASEAPVPQAGTEALARLLLGDSNMLILDEPTNHLDIYALEALEKVLSDYAGTLLLVSHDRRFLNGAAKRLLIIENGALTEFEGTPDEYDKKRAVRDEDAERQRRERELGVDALRMRMAAIDARLNGKGISGDEREQLEGEYFAIAKQLREMQK